MALILIVEDNPQNMKLATLLLEDAGHEVIQAFDAESGIESARERLPRLVLMDVHLPGVDGLDATRRLKADARTAAIPIYALTACAMQGDEQRILAAGCDGYIAKPIRHHAFQQVVERALAQGD